MLKTVDLSDFVYENQGDTLSGICDFDVSAARKLDFVQYPVVGTEYFLVVEELSDIYLRRGKCLSENDGVYEFLDLDYQDDPEIYGFGVDGAQEHIIKISKPEFYVFRDREGSSKMMDIICE